MATLLADSYHQEIERALQQSGTSLDYHVHSFIQNFYKHVQDNDRDVLLKFIPNQCDTIIELSSKFWNRQIQFILDSFLICVFMYQWTVEQFMTKSALFSSIPKTSRPWQLVFQYLREFIKYIAEPIVPIKNDAQDDDDDDEDDDDHECKHDQAPLQEFNSGNKHSLDRLLYYLFQIHEGMNRRESHRQIDMVFIPKQLNQIDDKFFADKGIQFMKLSDCEDIHHLLNRFHDSESREKLSFCRGVMVIIGDDNNNINDDVVYLFELLNSDVIPEGTLQYTEMPMIYNTTHDPKWLDDIIRENNGVIISYHHHNIDMYSHHKRISTRLYVFHKSVSGRCYGTRVLKEHILDVLKVFCNNNDCRQCWDDDFNAAQFNDVMYSDFIDLYLNNLGIQSESNADAMSLRSATPFSCQSDWNSENEQNDEKMEAESHFMSNNRGINSESVSVRSGTPFSWPSDWNNENGQNDEKMEVKSYANTDAPNNSNTDSESVSLRSGTPFSLPTDWNSEHGQNDEQKEAKLECKSNSNDNNSESQGNDINSILLIGSNHLRWRNSFVPYRKNETLLFDVGHREYRIEQATQMRLLVGYLTMIDIIKYARMYWMIMYILKFKEM